MASKNKISLIGWVGSKPEIKDLEGGRKVCNFSMATSERYQDKKDGIWKDAEPDWHRIAVWGKRGEAVAKILNKGALVGVEGRLSVRSYEKDGVRMPSIQVVAEEVLFLEKYEPKDPAQPEHDDDLPF